MIQSKNEKLPQGGFTVTLDVTVFGSSKPAVLTGALADKASALTWVGMMSCIYFIRNFMVFASAIVTTMSRSGDPLANAFAARVSKCIDDVRTSVTLKDACASFQLCSTTFEEAISIMSSSPDKFEQAAGKFVKESYDVLNAFAAKVVK